MKYYMIENHPQDSRVKIRNDDVCQTLPANMGGGGGNTPMVLIKEEIDEQKQLPNTLRCTKQTDIHY